VEAGLGIVTTKGISPPQLFRQLPNQQPNVGATGKARRPIGDKEGFDVESGQGSFVQVQFLHQVTGNFTEILRKKPNFQISKNYHMVVETSAPSLNRTVLMVLNHVL
jgi:hypothetical protein